MVVRTRVQILYKKIQNEAARIVTGLTRFVSLENLFLECGWQSLKDRRETPKIFFMYKPTHQMVPQYVADLIPPIIADSTQYAPRNLRDLRNILLALQFLKNLVSFLQYIFEII